MSDSHNKREQQLSIEISADIAEGKYANAVLIHQSKTEFILDFVNTCPAPGVPKARVSSRIILNPIHAKKLLQVLGGALKNYEEQFGDLDGAASEGEEIVFTGPAAKA